MNVSMASFLSASHLFFMSARERVKYLRRLRTSLLWACRRTAQNIASPSVHHLELESICTGNSGQRCPHPSTHYPLWAMVQELVAFNQRDVWRESMGLMTINACSYKYWPECFQIHHPAFQGDTPIHNHPPNSLCLFSILLKERNDRLNS